MMPQEQAYADLMRRKGERKGETVLAKDVYGLRGHDGPGPLSHSPAGGTSSATPPPPPLPGLGWGETHVSVH